MKIRDFFRKLKGTDNAQTSLHLRDFIIGKIIQQLHGAAVMQTKIFIIKLVAAGVESPIATQAVLSHATFTPSLERALADHLIEPAKGWKFEYEIVNEFEPTADTSSLGDGYYLQAILLDTDLVKRKAIIVALKGQLIRPSIELEPNSSNIYNIGRGTNIQLDNGYFQNNQIAFTTEGDENYNAAEAEPNAFVSRGHAAIFYDNRMQTYLLKVYPGGMFLKDNRTRIHRVSNLGLLTIDVNNQMINYPLHHKDQIELGKAALLEFSLEK